jgi:general secretion pathway protein I
MTVKRGLSPFLNPLFQQCRREPRRQRGFSLLEALVAMAIASIALASLYRSVGQSSKNVVDVEARVEASLVAKSALAAGVYAEDLIKQDSGQSGAWRWRIQVVPEQVPMTDESGRPAPGGPVRAARVTVEVSRDGVTAVTWTTWKPYRSAS